MLKFQKIVMNFLWSYWPQITWYANNNAVNHIVTQENPFISGKTKRPVFPSAW